MSSISRRELRTIIESALRAEGFSHSGPDPAYALSPAEIMRMRDAGIDVANKDMLSPEAQPYLDSNLVGGAPRGSAQADVVTSLRNLRQALKSGADLGPDDRDALLDVVEKILGSE